jgi:uncharacterized protein
MVHRDAARGSLDVWRTKATHRIDADTVLLYCAQGVEAVRVNGAEHGSIEAGDTLRIDARATLHIESSGAGALLAIALNMKSP